MTRATVEDSTTGMGQTLRTGRLLVGGLSFHDVSGLCTNSLAHRLPGRSQAQCMRHDAGVGLSLHGVGQLLLIHTPWVAISVVSSVDPTFNTAQQQTDGLSRVVVGW